MHQTQDQTLMGFYKVMNPQEKKTFWGCFMGWARKTIEVTVN